MYLTRYHRNLLNSDDMEHVNCNCLRPRADLERNESDYRLYLELPGVSREDVRVEIDEGVLTIIGEKKNHADENLETVSSERDFGKFARSFRLGREIDSENIRVEFNEGLLQVLLPRTTENRKRTISIN